MNYITFSFNNINYLIPPNFKGSLQQNMTPEKDMKLQKDIYLLLTSANVVFKLVMFEVNKDRITMQKETMKRLHAHMIMEQVSEDRVGKVMFSECC